MVAALGLLMLVVCLVAGEGWIAWGFLAMVAISSALAIVGRLVRNDDNGEAPQGVIMASVALVWAMAMALGAVPMWFAGQFVPEHAMLVAFASPVDALFESVSGFTSTGLTMVSDPSTLPNSLQFWRSLMEWVGGIGIALLAIVALNPDTDTGDMTGTEINASFADDTRRMVKWIWAIYSALTAFGVLLYAALGMPWWESLNHGMTSIGTGGFVVTDDSFGSYSSAIKMACVLLTILGALSFAAWYQAISRRSPLDLLRRSSTVFVLAGIFVATILLWLSQIRFENDGTWVDLVLQSASALGTAGFYTVPLGEWHSAPLMVLILCMVIGGASGATTGGIKVDRVLLICRGIGWRLMRQFGELDNGEFNDDSKTDAKRDRLRVEAAATLVALWMLTALLGSLTLAPIAGDDWSFTEVSFEVISALGSAGMSTGITSAELPDTGKWLLMILMWMGRLELFAVLALLFLPFREKAQ